MAKALVTGGAGFIGSHLADALLMKGYEVVVVDNESTGSRSDVPNGAQYILGDIQNKDILKEAFGQGVDVVFHAAAQASMIKSFSEPFSDVENNILGTLNILDFCIKTRTPRLLFASSMTCYGYPAETPTNEKAVCCPISYYGITKYAAERYVHATAERRDLNFELQVTSFRMFNVYGERQSLDNPYQGVMAIFISEVLNNNPITIDGDGSQSRDFVYVKDVVNAWISSVDNPDTYGQVINIGTGNAVSINELADQIIEAENKKPSDYPRQYGPSRLGCQRHIRADISKAREILGWTPETEFKEGLYHTVEWAKQHLRQTG